jgi:hypothetical protein
MKSETEVPVVAKMQSPRPDRLRARIGQAELAQFNAVGSMKDIVAASEEDLFDATDADVDRQPGAGKEPVVVG